MAVWEECFDFGVWLCVWLCIWLCIFCKKKNEMYRLVVHLVVHFSVVLTVIEWRKLPLFFLIFATFKLFEGGKCHELERLHINC